MDMEITLKESKLIIQLIGMELESQSTINARHCWNKSRLRKESQLAINWYGLNLLRLYLPLGQAWNAPF